jgi:alkylated DNA repair dioxygenase AlkB
MAATRELFQPSLFSAEPSPVAEGLRYRDGIISVEEEQALAALIAALPLKPFEFMGGFRGNRRVTSFGWRYDFNSHQLHKAADIPYDLLELRQKAATIADMAAESFQQVLVTEYAPGAGIGWHKDRPVFGEVIGVSLLAACRFRLRRKTSAGWKRMSFLAQPRSAYLLSGIARTEWQHSIPPVEEIRYSVTFRNFAKQCEVDGRKLDSGG